MADVVPEISGGAVVLVGSFNPKIFQPEWFVRQGLLRQEEAEAAEIQLIAPQVCQFETERFSLQVTPERFAAQSKASANPAPIRDLVQGTFFILEHTPLTAMGLNFSMHFAMESEEKWHQLGDKLVPKGPWNEVLDGRPGMASLVILTNKAEPPGALYRVKVEPSAQLKHGVYFEINEHYPAPAIEPSAAGLMDILGNRWEEAQIYASKVVNHILSWARANASH